MDEQREPIASAVSAEAMNQFFEKAFPGNNGTSSVRLAERGRAVVGIDCGVEHTRPGGFVSGPVQMALADQAAYAAIFTEMGITPMALTSNLNINFLRPCKGSWVEADARIMKSGRTQVIVEVTLTTDESDKVTSHAIVTYVMPREVETLEKDAGDRPQKFSAV